jgi:FtsP/CotA-like multicopper oxidase with cupredoxin domain
LPDVAQSVPEFDPVADSQTCLNPDGTVAHHVHGPRSVPDNTEYVYIYERPVLHRFHPDLPDNVLWGYTDDPSGPGKIPGPTIVAKAGTPQLVRFVNQLPANDPVGIGEPISAIHRHGGFQNPEDDGYPLDTFCGADGGRPPEMRDYYFPNPADGELMSTLWYHDHSIDVTGPNVYRGLAGFYPNRNRFDSLDENDASPDALRLPSGPYDIGLVVQDRLFDATGRLIYDSFDHDGFIGDQFCVNGLIQPVLTVHRRRYRFRILNGSNARVYQLFLSTGEPFLAIGTDSNLLEKAIRVPSIRCAPAERVEFVIDFRNAPSEVFIVNRMQQTEGRKPDGLVSPGTRILKFAVSDEFPADPSRPLTEGDSLLAFPEHPSDLRPRVKVQRRFKFDRSEGAWTINNRLFDENRVDARPKLGEPEIWILESGGGWVHPFHVHLNGFFILSRDGRVPPAIERGRKDTILIGGDIGREARILVKFDDPRQPAFRDASPLRYVSHCHNIEHEDMRMMMQFEAQP